MCPSRTTTYSGRTTTDSDKTTTDLGRTNENSWSTSIDSWSIIPTQIQGIPTQIQGVLSQIQEVLAQIQAEGPPLIQAQGVFDWNLSQPQPSTAPREKICHDYHTKEECWERLKKNDHVEKSMR